MPDVPNGKDGFEYRKRPQPNFRAVCSEEELGDMHLSTENYSVALEYYEKALQKIHLAPQPGDLFRIYRKISDCYRKKGLLRESLTFLRSAETHCDEADDFGKGTLVCRRAMILQENGQIEKALHEASAAYRLLRTSDDHREVANAQLLLANCYLRLGRQDEAEQYFLDALSSYRRIEDAIHESYVLNNLGVFHKDACRFGKALDYFTKALEICDRMGLTQHRLRVTLNIGVAHLKARDFAHAVSAFSTARKQSRSTGDEIQYARASLMLGAAETRLGDVVAAEKHLLEARVIAERRAYGREIALADEYLGDLMAARGDLAGAMENYSTALSRARKMAVEGDIVAEVLRRQAEVFILQRKPQETLAVGVRALEIAGKCGEVHEVGFIRRAMALAHAQLGSDDEAEKHIASSVKAFREASNAYEATRSSVLFAEQLVARGTEQALLRARKLVSGALAHFEQAEEYRDLAESHFLMARIERELKNRDECLLHLYEAQRFAEDMRDRNMLRRVRRLRRGIEDEVVGELAPASQASGLAGQASGVFASNPHLITVLDHLLGDLMNKITFKHGFVAIAGTGRKVTVLARRSVTEASAKTITEWFISRDEAERSAASLVTDVLRDRRSAPIRDALPGRGGPIYVHPLTRDGETLGLLFFQSDADGSVPPRLGQVPDVVASYASFIDFLVQGSAVQAPASKTEPRRRAEDFRHVITRNDRMLRVLGLAEKVARSDATVLLLGETGTGKGLVAQAIHRMSPRRDGKFVHVNCAALPETILESELFGHVKGSFTGAICDKKGLIAEADGGTVFLDEISKTSVVLQGKLLQFLDARRVRPVGGNEMVPVNVRLIFASKTDLLAMVREGGMLEDFYYRINDFPITIPPLRERVEDIHLLAEYYVKTFGERMGKRVRGFSEDALSTLTSYEWPGNVRELEKIVMRAMILADEDGIISPDIITFDEGKESISRDHRLQLPDRVKDLEKRVISECLIRNGWNRSVASHELGISYPTLLKKIRDLDIVEGY